MPGRYLEEFQPGQVFRHGLRKTVTESDNVMFSVMTLNPQPLHIDFDFAQKSEWGKPLVNSLFTLGYYYRGAALLRLGTLKEAEKTALDALQTVDAKVFPETHFLLGEVYAEQREYPLAAREYRIYLAEGPSGEWGNYVNTRLNEWELLGIIEPATKQKRRG